jgi:aminopeptidase C
LFPFQDSGKALKFRVENSWGDERNEKGYIMMTSDWFKEWVYEVVVDRDIVPKEITEVDQTDIKVKEETKCKAKYLLDLLRHAPFELRVDLAGSNESLSLQVLPAWDPMGALASN